MYPNGYIMVDCYGLDLSDSSAQETDTLFDDTVAALTSGKPIVLAGCVMNDEVISPIHAFAYASGESEYTIIAAHYSIVVDSTSATVTDLIS